LVLFDFKQKPCGYGRPIEGTVMSQHRSLKSGSALGGKRNVLRRYERVALLKKRGEWKEGDRVTGLRKTKDEE
jgi:small basic protein (TIGR04137 family)|tara:strand:- start:174 stop:392 length:219 start_codon:yes stop_codon:yes gene_type:complete